MRVRGERPSAYVKQVLAGAVAVVGFCWLWRLGYSVVVASDGGPNSNRTLSRIAALLDAFDSATVLSASGLADRSGLSRSTAHRLAVSLVEYGFLERTTGGDFALGPRLSRRPIEQLATGALERLSSATREAAQLWVRRGTVRVCLVSVESEHDVRVALPVGSYAPLPEGSAGRLLGGELTALRSVAEHGWVESVGSSEGAVASVSAPVYRGGDIVAAVSVTLPLTRVTLSPGEDFGQEAVAAATALSVVDRPGAL